MALQTDRSTIECEETFEFYLFFDVSFSSRRNHRARAACRVFKADVLRESRKIGLVPGLWLWDRRWKLAAVSHCSRTARQSSTLERGNTGRRRRIHIEKTKIVNIIDTRIRIHTSTSWRVKVKSKFGGLQPIEGVCVDPVPVYMVALPRTQLICWPSCALCSGFSWVEAQFCHQQWVAEQRSKTLAIAQRTALVDGEASAGRSKKTFSPHGRVLAYGKHSTKRRQLWGSLRWFG